MFFYSHSSQCLYGMHTVYTLVSLARETIKENISHKLSLLLLLYTVGKFKLGCLAEPKVSIMVIVKYKLSL